MSGLWRSEQRMEREHEDSLVPLLPEAVKTDGRLLLLSLLIYNAVVSVPRAAVPPAIYTLQIASKDKGFSYFLSLPFHLCFRKLLLET